MGELEEEGDDGDVEEVGDDALGFGDSDRTPATVTWPFLLSKFRGAWPGRG